MHRTWKPTLLGLPFLLLASAAALSQQPQLADPTRNLTPVTDQMLLNPPDGDWLMWRRTYSVNGKQYVAVAVGNGSSHARSLATLTPELKNPDGGSVLWVFALPN